MTPELRAELEKLLAIIITRETHKGAVNRIRHQALASIEKIIVREKITELQAVHDHWRRTHQSEKVQDQVDQRLAQLQSKLDVNKSYDFVDNDGANVNKKLEGEK